MGVKLETQVLKHLSVLVFGNRSLVLFPEVILTFSIKYLF